MKMKSNSWNKHLLILPILEMLVILFLPQSADAKDIASYLTFDNSKGYLDKEIEDNLRAAFVKVYPDICAEFNNGKLREVKYVVDPNYDGVAYTTDAKVVMSSAYLNEHPEDYDCITHELVHVAQNYTAYVDEWVGEGLADYGRNKYGVNNSAAEWSLEQPQETALYTDGYTTTAAFFTWVEETYGGSFVQKLNKICKDGTYSIDCFEEITGMDIDTLWEKYFGQWYETEAEVDLSVPTPAKISDDTDISSYLTLVDKKKKVSSSLKKKIKKLFAKRYADICTMFNNGELLPVTITFDASEEGVAYTVGTNIVVGAAHLKERPEDYDCVTHELIHVAQQYTGNAPDWLVEGIADYGRYLYGVNNEKAGWSLPMAPKKGSSYSDGYTTTAAFLLWLEESEEQDVVAVLNQVLKRGDYSNSVWKQMTGKTLSALWKEYMKTRYEVPDAGENVGNLVFKDLNGKDVETDSFKGKYIYMSFCVRWGGLFDDVIAEIKGLKKTYGKDLVVVMVTEESASAMKKHVQAYNKKIDKSIFLWRDVKGISRSFCSYKGGRAYRWPTNILIGKNGKLLISSNFGKENYRSVNNGWKSAKEAVKSILGSSNVTWTSKGVQYTLKNYNAKFRITNQGKVKKKKVYGATMQYVAPIEKTKSVEIPDTVKVDGVTYKVTSISNNAFANNKKVTKITIGKNVKTIGDSAFKNCKKLSSIVVKTSKLKTVGDNVLQGIHKKAVISVPQKKLTVYKELFKGKGQANTVKIKKCS